MAALPGLVFVGVGSVLGTTENIEMHMNCHQTSVSNTFWFWNGVEIIFRDGTFAKPSQLGDILRKKIFSGTPKFSSRKRICNFSWLGF